jgi:predicted dehydrogenase
MNDKSFGWCFIGSGSITDRVMRDLEHAAGSWPVAVFSRNLENARRFAQAYGARAYATAAEAMGDPAVRAVYVATPHSSHKEYTLQALRRGLPVLCEKPLTLTLADAKEMIGTARRQGVYLCEAMWTGHNPVTQQVLAWVRAGRVGRVRSLQASFSFFHAYNPDSRLYDPALGGGALLDVGVYTAAFAQLLFGDVRGEITGVTADRAENGVDSLCAVTLRYGPALARLFCGVAADEPQDVFVGGEAGHIVMPHFWAAKSATLRTQAAGEVFAPNFPGEGFQFEFDAVRQDILAGRKENGIISHEFSLRVMEMLEEVRRRM